MVTTPLAPPSFPPCDDRWTHQRARRRQLEGRWEDDLKARLEHLVGPLRNQAWGPGDTTKNNFKSTVQQLATLYDQRGSVTSASPEAAKLMEELLTGAGWWELAIRHHLKVVGLRESLVRVSVRGGTENDPARLQVRLVEPDLVHAEAPFDDPDVPHLVVEWLAREFDTPEGTTELRWTRDVLDIRDPEAPTYRVFDAAGKEDLTEKFLGTGGEWPERWKDSAGRPVLPYVLYHAVRTGQLWDEREGMELVTGSLNIAVLWTYWNHIVRDCSHPQRVLGNARPAGGGQMVRVDAHEVPSVPEDPAAMLLFEAIREGAPLTFHQFQPGGDPEALGRAIRDYAADLAVDYGINASDIERTHGNAQSGFAVQLSNIGVRRAQLQYTPGAARGDSQLFRAVACQYNRATDSSLPEDGWGAAYRGLQLQPEERKQLLEELQVLLGLGLISKVDMWMQLEGCTREQAVEHLNRVAQEVSSAASEASTNNDLTA